MPIAHRHWHRRVVDAHVEGVTTMWTRSMGVALVSVLMAWPAAAQNAVHDWSLRAQNVITAGRSPASSEYLLALVHAAMYDAVVAIEGEYRPFGVRVEVNHPASADAAVAAAAYHVLRHRVPASEPALTTGYIAYVSALPGGIPRANGLQVGSTVAMQWLALRADDRFDATVTYEPPPAGPGTWEPTATTPPVDVKIAQVRPYVMGSPDRFRPRGPRRLESRAYARAFDEVYDVGRSDSVNRTPDQLEVARFWAEHTAVQWNRNLRELAAAAQLDLVGTARMLAMVHVASADATVGCFEAKYSFRFWRPVHAIQRADIDENPRTAPDVTWNALLNVNHPEYPSAHSCWTQAVTDTLGHVFGTDRAEFELSSTVTGGTRRYTRFSEVAEEVQDARVWAGIHFRFSTADGADIGRQVARLVTRYHFRPVRQ
jgi:hypothetical protein